MPASTCTSSPMVRAIGNWPQSTCGTIRSMIRRDQVSGTDEGFKSLVAGMFYLLRVCFVRTVQVNLDAAHTKELKDTNRHYPIQKGIINRAPGIVGTPKSRSKDNVPPTVGLLHSFQKASCP